MENVGENREASLGSGKDAGSEQGVKQRPIFVFSPAADVCYVWGPRTVSCRSPLDSAASQSRWWRGVTESHSSSIEQTHSLVKFPKCLQSVYLKASAACPWMCSRRGLEQAFKTPTSWCSSDECSVSFYLKKRSFNESETEATLLK